MNDKHTKRAGVRVRGPVLTHPVATNMEIVGFSDMGGRRDGLQMQYQEVAGRHYLYVGHFWGGGITILDVTDPAVPEVAGFVPTPNEATWHIKVQVAENLMLVPCEQNFFALDVDGSQAKTGVRVFDVSNPTRPEELAFYETRGAGVHRSWWNGGRYAYLSEGVEASGTWMHGTPGVSRVMSIIDLADPRNPTKVSEFWLPAQLGQEDDGSTVYVHEPVIEGDRAYIAYWDGGFAIVDISDRSAPVLLSHVPTYPEISEGCTHTCVPLLDRNLLVVCEENGANYGGEGPKKIWVYDISDERSPRLVSEMPTPVPSAEEPYATYLERGERFGPHCVHQNHLHHLQTDQKVYATYCNAGLRVFDITDPAHPVECASFVPPDPEVIVDPRPFDRQFDIVHGGSRTACTQDVLVDPRGFIYLTGTNDGLWIVRES